MAAVTHLIWFLIVGLLAGWLASLAMKGRKHTVAGYMIIGVIGALLGGWVFGLLGLSAGGLLGSLVMAFVGAVLLIFLIRALGRV